VNDRLVYHGVDINTRLQNFTVPVGAPLTVVFDALPGTVELRPPTPQERFEDICKEIREQRYILLRDPDEQEWYD
jgi:hypothetical protein